MHLCLVNSQHDPEPRTQYSSQNVIPCLFKKNLMLTESRGGAVGDHEPRVQASFVDQERREFAERWIAKTFDAPLADGCQLVHRDRQIIQSL